MSNITIGCKRVIALHATTSNLDEIVQHMQIAALLDVGAIVIFAPSKLRKPDEMLSNCSWIAFPDEAGTIPKQKNFILDWCKLQGFTGFLHIVENDILFNERSKSYMDVLESTMSALDYDVHLSTVTDKCNYVFNKFCPRLAINVDDDNIRQKLGLPRQVRFTSHSNVSYTTYNLAASNGCPLKFDERFTIGMFYIIEFLARRKATQKAGQLYFMNQYLSIADEDNAFDVVRLPSKNVDNAKMQEEDALFKSLNVNYAPDNNLDLVLDTFYGKIKEKMSI